MVVICDGSVVFICHDAQVTAFSMGTSSLCDMPLQTEEVF